MPRKKRKTTKRKKSNIKNFYNFSEEILNKLFKKKRYKKVVEWDDEKEEVRKTKEWLELKCFCAHRQDMRDPLTDMPLNTNANLHHRDFHDENYGNFNSDNFVLLNQLSHKVLHTILAIMHRRGPEVVINFLLDEYKKHEKLNGDIKTWKQAH